MPIVSVHALTDLRGGARRIAAAYTAIGLLWITTSDALFHELIANHALDGWVETLKGYAYVLLTGYLLYVAITRLHRQQRHTQERLQRSEQAYRAIFDSHPNALWVYDPRDLRILAANEAATRQLGYSEQEFCELTLDTFCPGMRSDILRLTRRASQDKDQAHCVLRGRTRDGRTLQLEATARAVDFEERATCLLWAVDITEHSRVADELQEARQRMQDANRIAGLGYWALDSSSEIVAWSEQMPRVVGRDCAEPPHRAADLLDWVEPDDRAALAAAVQQAWEGQRLEVEVRTRHGAETGYLLLRGELIERGGARLLMGTVLDITARKRTEQRLQASERQYRQLIELMPLAVLIVRDRHVVFANPAAAALFGTARPDELCGCAVAQLVATSSRATAGERLRQLEEAPETADMSFQERQLKKVSGEIFSAEVAAQPLLVDDERCIQVMVRDVSAQKQTQAALKLANERLLRLSTRAIEVAEEERQQLSRELHDDIGQLLTFIKMSSAWIQKHQTGSEIAERARQVNATAGEALQKVRNLALTLRPAQLDTLGLRAAMEEHLHKFLSGHTIDYVLLGDELQPRPQPLVEMALFRIFQEALTNIIRHSGASHIEIELEPSPQGLRLRIVDDGCGFDVAEALGAGGSLGLHTMTERAEQLGGSLAIHAVAGVGTEVVAVIPCGAAQ